MPSKKEKSIDLKTVLAEIEAGHIAPVYLLFGEDIVAINRARRTLIDYLIPLEFRDGNLNEFVGKGLNIMDLITLSDTYPFLASRRVITIENYPNLSGTKSKKLTGKAATEVDRLAEYILNQQATWSTLIFSFEEVQEKGRTVSKTNPLVAAIKKQGIILEFPIPDSIFKFLDTVGERNTQSALRYLDLFFHNEIEKKEPAVILRMLVRTLRYWLQAKLLETRNPQSTIRNPQSEGELPETASLNLFQQHPFVQSKIKQQAARFTKPELTTALIDLVTLEDKLNPRATDIMGEDPELVLETWLTKFIS